MRLNKTGGSRGCAKSGAASGRMVMAREFKNPAMKLLWEYGLITGSILMMVVGIYFFKFPNHFAFGGVTGFSTVVSAVTRMSAGDFTLAANMALLLAGFAIVGRQFGIKTVYASVLMSVLLSALEKLYPMSRPLTSEPVLELIFAIFLPAVGSAVLFNIGASSGGTDIIALILKKYTSFHIGTALFLADFFAVAASFFIFGPATGLFSSLGIMAKSLMVDGVIENINLCKCFHIVCDDPTPICEYIINGLHRSATIYEAQGAFTHSKKAVVMTTMKRGQAVQLRNYIRNVEPTAFMMVTDSSEIIGKGFLSS